MNAKILTADEWAARRKHHDSPPTLAPFTHPNDLAIVVVEDDAGEIVASMTVAKVTHFEDLWIDPERRGNAGIIRALLGQAYAIPRSRGELWVIGGAAKGDDRMSEFIARLGGAPLAAEFFALGVGG